MELAAVADKPLAMAFKMAGVKEVHTNPDAVKALLKNKDLGLLMITKKILDLQDDAIKEQVFSSVRPTVVVLDESEDNMVALIKRMIGVEVR